MATETYKVVADQLTVHRNIGDLIDPITKTVIGFQQGQGKTYYKDEVIPKDHVSPHMIEALEDEDHELHEAMLKRIEKVTDEPSLSTKARLGIPFAGYEDMSEDAILSAMSVLPSSTIQAIKRYEAEVGVGRERIVNYNIGFGESPSDRAEGRVGSDRDALDPDKDVAKIQTREVPEQGVVTPGEGITGTGDPAVPPGTAAAQSDEEDDDDDNDSPRPARQRRGRRPAAQRSAAKKDDKSESGS